MLKVGVILSGCGVYDGSEIHEAVFALLAIDRQGALAVCLAPDKDQADVINHRTGQSCADKRNILTESARIARGKIKSLSQAKPEDVDAVVIPGGAGATKNLQDDPQLARFLEAVHAAGKPIGAACLAPLVLAKVFGRHAPELTIGGDDATAQALEALGGRHKAAALREVVVDQRLKLASTPAYMLSGRISEVALSLENLVAAVLEMCSSRR